MKSDGIDQMNTVAKTAEYPFERFALRGEAGSLLAVDILYFIASGPGLLNGRSDALSSAHRIRMLRATRWSGETADTTASPMHAPKLWEGPLHKFSRL
jgi:hypothetical protein